MKVSTTSSIFFWRKYFNEEKKLGYILYSYWCVDFMGSYLLDFYRTETLIIISLMIDHLLCIMVIDET